MHTHSLDGKQGSADSYLFGLAAGPFIAGVLSDVWGLTAALTAMPAFGLLAPLAFSVAARTYEADMRRAASPSTCRPRPPQRARAMRLPLGEALIQPLVPTPPLGARTSSRRSA